MPSTKRLSDRLKLLNFEDDEVEDSLVIGIDFGTTYSGVAWATRVDFANGQVNFITSWPGHGREEGKAPTELWYSDDEEPAWGYEVPVDADPFRWFKLLLVRVEDLKPEVRDSKFLVRARAMMEESGRTAVDLVADYLRLLWEHITSTVDRARGETIVEALPIHVVITVPAIWESYERRAMEDSAKKAGILKYRLAGATKLTFAPEPEAAALSTLHEQGSGVRPGNVYIVCDAGGGTVDLISYEVKSTKPIVLAEAVEGTGRLAGGIFIDETFEQMCKGRLKHKWNQLSKAGLRDVMKNEWEYGIKPQFRPGKVGKTHIVSLPAELFRETASSLNDTKRKPYIKDGRIHFTDDDIKKPFANVFVDIKELVEGQIQKATKKGISVTGIILVGGLGASPYLYDYLKAMHSKAGITVLQSGGIKPRTAICRGAVMKGFLEEPDQHGVSAPIMIASTVSRASYGIDFLAKFDTLHHVEEDRVWDYDEALWMARNQMTWYLKRGQIVSRTEPVRMPWYNTYKPWKFDGTLSVILFQCNDEVPPNRKTSSVQQLGTLRCNLDILYSDLPKFRNHQGDRMKKLNFELEMVPSGASVEFVLYADGRKQGSKSVKISFE
ncbi:hypothetical protein E0Z10_g1906 [Xylaria hypoxylon]|uniref:Actin-like ATPase domain-containing protein n=1 Tax=Xylaria hypoxylon TaxID=37992 RepID=A0A4Z0Z3U8_9PEZI|nr:hypothetical protein E0Z10_g1906 [Xylaria hypoxylon]